MIRLIITISLLFIAMWIIFFLGLQEYDNWQEGSADLSAEKTRLENREEYVSTIEKIYNQLEKRQEEMTKVHTSLPPDHYIPALFSYIKKIETSHGVIFDGLGPFEQRESDIAGIKEITTSFQVLGSYRNIKRLFATMENLSRIIEINTAAINYNIENDILGIRLQIKTYSY